MLFSGTVRSNLDPFDEHTDAEILEVLAQVQLVDYPSNNMDSARETNTNSKQGFSDLATPISESGGNRLSTISDFDKVLVLDDGRMVEFGTPSELWLKDGFFRSMCESNSDSEKEKLRNSIFGTGSSM